MDQMALLGHLVNEALQDPPAQQLDPLAHQGELLTSAGGGLCAQMLLEQSLFMMALLQVLTLATQVAEPTTSA